MALTACPERSAPLNYRFLRRLFNFLMVEEVIKTNPMAKLKPPKIEQRIIEPLSLRDLQKLFRVARTGRGFQGVRDCAILATLAGTGIRGEELCNLRDEDVRLKEAVMLIHGKGRKQRLIPIPAHLIKTLARYRSTRNGSRVSNVGCIYFFRNRFGRQMTTDSLTQLMSQLGEYAGIKLHPHLLRHTSEGSFAPSTIGSRCIRRRSSVLCRNRLMGRPGPSIRKATVMWSTGATFPCRI